MNPHITPIERDRVAQHWRQSPEAQAMQPQQVEQFAQQIVSGGADAQVSRYLSQLQAPQAAQGPNVSSFHTLIGGLQMPGITMPTMPAMPIMPAMQFPARPQMPFTTPMAPPQMSGMPFMPMTPAVALPQVTQETMHFPGGSASVQNVSLSGGNGNATFSYSSSSTSGSWSSNNTPITAQQILPALQGYPRQIAIEAVPSTPGFVQQTPPTPLQPPPLPPQPIFPLYTQLPFRSVSPPTPRPAPSLRRDPSFSQAVPAVQSIESTSSRPQNSRLHSVFAQQLSDEGHDTYFSNPPGAPGQVTSPPQPLPRQREREPI